MRQVVVTGVGIVCALGNTPSAVDSALAAGRSGVVAADDERVHLPIAGLGCASVDVRPLLKRKKDRKLLPRAAELAIVAAHDAYGEHRSTETALFVGVGREPPEVGTESALVASMTNGKLDSEKLHSSGMAVYPPLAPLKTLPNLILAHVAIQLGTMGEGGTRTGGASAGLAAVIAGFQAVAEGRSDVALVGAADSLVAAGSARDAVRCGLVSPGGAPGEAAVFFRLETEELAVKRDARILAKIQEGSLNCRPSRPWREPFAEQLGVCGVASGTVWWALQLLRGMSGSINMTDRSGGHARLRWEADAWVRDTGREH
jgi:3-oxoacyl-[acyl-carrier-protein] synthase II